MDADKPIIVVKKKGGHGGHHGGAWKIAYADFITAMMAFFLVMWLVNSASTPTKERIASYFRRPGLFEQGSGTPLEMGGSGILDDAYVPSYPAEKQNEVGESQIPRRKGFEEGPYGVTDEAIGFKKDGVPTPQTAIKPGQEYDEEHPKEVDRKMKPREEQEEGEILEEETPVPAGTGEIQEGDETQQEEDTSPEKMAEKIKEEINASPELANILGAVDVSIDADSLNIEIMDTEKTSMFASGSAYIREEAREAFKKLASALQGVKNKIEIVGHTDAHPFTSRNHGYSNWELSVDRANAARRLLTDDGVDQARILGVLGKADTQPRISSDPFAAGNRRITLKMKFDVARAIPPTIAPTPKAIDMKRDADAARKLQETTRAMEQENQSNAPEPLERVHTLTPKEIIQRSASVPTPVPRRAPGIAAPPSFKWKDPKFPGEN